MTIEGPLTGIADPDSATPFRKRILVSITEALAEITPANGYRTDLSVFTHDDGAPMRRCYFGRAFFGDDDPLPMVAVLERPEPADELSDQPRDTSTGAFYWELIVQGFAEDDKDDPTDEAYDVLTDVRHRLALERARRGGPRGNQPDPFGLGGVREYNRVEEISFGSGVVRPADEVSAKAYFWLGVTLKIIEDPLFPFA